LITAWQLDLGEVALTKDLTDSTLIDIINE
jgi:hypothetical protein